MTAGEALQRLTDWARGSMAPFVRIDADGHLVVDLSTKEAQDNLHLIKDLEVVQTERRVGKRTTLVSTHAKIRLHDAKDAVAKLAQVRGLLKDAAGAGPSVVTPVQVNVDVRIRDSRERLASRIAGIAMRAKLVGALAPEQKNRPPGFCALTQEIAL